MAGAYDIRLVNEMVEKETAFLDRLYAEVHKVVVGQTDMIERMFIGLPVSYTHLTLPTIYSV